MDELKSLTLNKINNYLIEKKLNLTDSQKDFIFIFFQTNSLTTTKNYLNISIEDAVKIYKDPLIQDILHTLQLYRHREMFKLKMLNLEEIGSYLSNQLLDFNLPESDRLTPREKLEAAKLLLEVHSKLNGALQNPIELNSYQILDMQFKDLSISTIKSLLHSKPTEDNLLNQSSLSNTKTLNINNKLLTNQLSETDVEILEETSKQKNAESIKKKKEKLISDKEVIKKVVNEN